MEDKNLEIEEQQDDANKQRIVSDQPLDPQRSSPSSHPATYPFDADGALCREFLLERGYCCGNGCRNCPYEEDDY